MRFMNNADKFKNVDRKGKWVRRVIQANGELSKNWQYNFMFQSKRYAGSTGHTDKKKAEKFVENLRVQLQSSLGYKAQDKALISFREKVTECIKGESIKLIEVWSVFRKESPALMRRQPCEKRWKLKEGYWNDFLAFIQSEYPKLIELRDIRKKQATEYVGHLKLYGKFNKQICSRPSAGKRKSNRPYMSKVNSLAPSTINEYITQLCQVFQILRDTASLLENPFEDIPKVVGHRKKRDIFEVSELKMISDYLDQGKLWDFTTNDNRKETLVILKSIFIIGINTGLRRGDISMMTWKNVKFAKNRIDMTTSKSDIAVSIPMSKPLRDYLEFLRVKYKGEKYVVPPLAHMYVNNPDGISYRFKQMLDQLGITNKKKIKGRAVNLSNKDIHSLRHTFCYLHGLQGTSIIELQSMVGHMTSAMTSYYMMHDSEIVKEAAQKSIEEFTYFGERSSANKIEEASNEIIVVLQKLGSRDLNEYKEDILRLLKEKLKL